MGNVELERVAWLSANFQEEKEGGGGGGGGGDGCGGGGITCEREITITSLIIVPSGLWMITETYIMRNYLWRKYWNLGRTDFQDCLVRFPFRTSLKSWILPIIKWIENKQTKPLEGGSLELQQLTVTGKIYLLQQWEQRLLPVSSQSSIIT